MGLQEAEAKKTNPSVFTLGSSKMYEAAQAYSLNLIFERDAQQAAVTRNAWSVHLRRSAPTHSQPQAIIVIVCSMGEDRGHLSTVAWLHLAARALPGLNRAEVGEQHEHDQDPNLSSGYASLVVMVSIKFTRENQRQCSATSSCRHDLMAYAPAPTHAWMHLDKNSATDSHQLTLTSSRARSLLRRLLHILRWPR